MTNAFSSMDNISESSRPDSLLIINHANLTLSVMSMELSQNPDQKKACFRFHFFTKKWQAKTNCDVKTEWRLSWGEVNGSTRRVMVTRVCFTDENSLSSIFMTCLLYNISIRSLLERWVQKENATLDELKLFCLFFFVKHASSEPSDRYTCQRKS